MRSIANHFTSSPRKKVFYKLCQTGVTVRKCASYPVFFHRVFKHLFEWSVSGIHNFLPQLWYQLKHRSSVARPWFCILIPHQKVWGDIWKEEWRIIITVFPVNPCARQGTAGWDSAVSGIGSATPEWLPCLCHRHGNSQTLLSERISAQPTCRSRYSESLEVLYME